VGRRYDDRRWIQNPDGSFTRISQAVKEVEAFEQSENYYKDIETTGAAADLAAELGVDLSEVEGSGKGGRITKADVEAAANA